MILEAGPGHDAGGGVHTGAEKIVAGENRFAGMQSDANFHGVFRISAVVAVQRALDADRALDGLARRVERDHETVADRLDLAAGVLAELLPHQIVMRVHNPVGRRLALVLTHAGRTDDIGEQHRHGCRFGHGACSSALLMAYWNTELLSVLVGFWRHHPP
jgi:hypothetical protein